MSSRLIVSVLVLLFPLTVFADCKTEIAVDGDIIYWTKGDNLYGGRLPKENGVLINPGGWCNASIAVSNGYFYWTQPLDDNLYGANITGVKWLGGTKLINEGGWRNTEIAVSGNYLYWAAVDERDVLSAARINGLEWLGGTKTLDSGGWKNTDIAVSSNYLYWSTKDGRDSLNGFKLDGLTRAGATERLNSGGWKTSSIAVTGDSFYWAAKDDRDALSKAKIDGLRWLGNTQIINHGGWRDEILVTTSGTISGQMVTDRIKNANALAKSAIEAQLRQYAQGNEASATVTSLRTEGTKVILEFELKHRLTFRVLGKTITVYDATTPSKVEFDSLRSDEALEKSKICIELPRIIGGQFCMTAAQIARVIAAAG